MEVHLIRHTTVDVQKGICYGQSDVDVSDTFIQEAAALRLKLDQDYECIYSSPLKRCTLLANQLNLGETRIDSRLKEINFGTWELKEWNDIDSSSLTKWHENIVHFNDYSGESLLVFQYRVQSFLQELLKCKGEKVMIVTHAGVIRLFYQFVMEFPLENMMKLPVQFGMNHVFEIDKNKSLCYIKDIR